MTETNAVDTELVALKDREKTDLDSFLVPSRDEVRQHSKKKLVIADELQNNTEVRFKMVSGKIVYSVHVPKQFLEPVMVNTLTIKKITDARKTDGLLVAYVSFQLNGVRYYDWHIVKSKLENRKADYFVASPRIWVPPTKEERAAGKKGIDYPTVLLNKEQYRYVSDTILASKEWAEFLAAKPEATKSVASDTGVKTDIKILLTPEFVQELTITLFGSATEFRGMPIVKVPGQVGDASVSNEFKKTTFGGFDFVTQNKSKLQSGTAARARKGEQIIFATSKANVAGKETWKWLALMANGKLEKFY